MRKEMSQKSIDSAPGYINNNKKEEKVKPHISRRKELKIGLGMNEIENRKIIEKNQ